MIRSILLPNGNVFIEKPFQCILNKESEEVTIFGGKIVPIYSSQRSFKVENEGVPIQLSSLREVYLNIKTTPLTNNVESATFITEEDAKNIKLKSDSALNMFLPICRYNSKWERMDLPFFNSNLNYTRQKGDEQLRGYFDDGQVYLNGFTSESFYGDPFGVTRRRYYGPQKIKAKEGDFILLNIKGIYSILNGHIIDGESDISVEVGEPDLGVQEVVIDTGTENSNDQNIHLSRKRAIGKVKNGNYLSFFSGNVAVDALYFLISESFYERDEVTETVSTYGYYINI